jgi:chemotaxis protein methyltransferase CheR
MRSTHTSNYTDYLKYLKANAPELETLRKALTINVTEFFRDQNVFEFLKDVVLPGLFRQKKKSASGAPAALWERNPIR